MNPKSIQELAELTAEEHVVQGLFDAWFYSTPEQCTPLDGDFDALHQVLGREITESDVHYFTKKYREHLARIEKL